MEIKVKERYKGLYTQAVDENGNPMPFINPKGDWIDLRAAKDYSFVAPQALTQKSVTVDGETRKVRDVVFDEQLIDLGIAMELPKGMVAKIKQRSSTTKKMRLVVASSGAIDTVYNGDNDYWKFYCYALGNTEIKKGDRICQFEIVPSQFATPWQKLKWLFSRRIKFVWVEELGNEDRGGHGSTGVK